MAHKLYYDNVGTSTATINDGSLSEGQSGGTGNDVYTFSNTSSISNESRAIDRDTTSAMSSFSVSVHSETFAETRDSLQFEFGASTTIDFVALFFNAAETDSIAVHHDDASTGVVTNVGTFTADFTTKWNIRSFTQVSNRYWHIAASSGTVDGITEIFFGANPLELPVSGDGITISKPYNSFIASTYNNTEFSNKIDTDLRTWQLKIPLLTESDKTALESLQSDYKNLYTFVYYDESEYHTVRLGKPLTFNQVATNTYSTSITLQESA